MSATSRAARCVLALAFFFLSTRAARADQAPWLTGSIAAAVTETAAAAAGYARPAPVTVLFDDVAVRVHADQRTSLRRRIVYRVNTLAGADDWLRVHHVYYPWFQKEPRVEAAVVDARGGLHRVAPEAYVESVGNVYGGGYTNEKRIGAPLPNVEPGAVVEISVDQEDEKPFFAAGNAQRIRFDYGVPLVVARVVIDVEGGLPFTYENGVDGRKPATKAYTGLARHTFTFWNPKTEVPNSAAYLPADRDPFPFVAFSTAASWNAVARGYLAMVTAAVDPAAVRDVAAGAGAGELRARIRRLVDRLHASVRYEAVELGETAIKPRTAAATLRNGYGDCKDKSVLLVSLLKAAGIDAEVALLRAVRGTDIRERLPGIGEFNHAIVYVPAADLWIDPTDPYAAIGDLPEPDQGRWALRISPQTTKVVRTPDIPSSRNVLVRERRVELADDGGATVTENLRGVGGGERSLRHLLSSLTERQRQEWVESYSRSRLRAGALASYRSENVDDMSRPFVLSIRAVESEWGYTGDGSAVYRILPLEPLYDLPSFLVGGGEDEPVHDMLIDDAFTSKTTSRVRAPEGYEVTFVPPSGNLAFGPMRLAWTLRKIDTRDVEAVVTFDTGRRRFSAAEVAAVRAAVKKSLKMRPLTIVFEQTARQQLLEGKVTEGLGEFRERARAHPGDPVFLSEFAQALLYVGLGEAAQRTARAAVAKNPDEARTHYILGSSLTKDLLGRAYGPGHRRDEAVAELKKAIALEPNDPGPRFELARLYEYGLDGVPGGDGADLAAALKTYQGLREEFKSPVDEAILHLLLQLGRYDDLQAFAERETRIPERHAYVFSVMAMQGAVTAAVERSLQLDYFSRQESMKKAANLLVQIRKYKLAASLVREAAKGSIDAVELRNQATYLESIKPAAEQLFDASPEGVVKAFLRDAYFADAKTRDDLRGYFTDDTQRFYLADPELAKPVLDGPGQDMRAIARSQGLTPPVVADMLLSIVQTVQRGNPQSGFTVTIFSPWASGDRAVQRYFLIQERGQYRIVGTLETPAALAVELYRFAEYSQQIVAAKWLEWMAEGMNNFPPESSFTALAHKPNIRREEMKLIAGELMVTGPAAYHDLGAQVLEKVRGEARTDSLRNRVQLAVLNGLRHQKRWKEAAQLLDALPPSLEFNNILFLPQADVFLHSGQLARLQTLLRLESKDWRDDPDVLRAQASLSESVSDYAKAAGYLRRLVYRPSSASLHDYAKFGWLMLLARDTEPESVALVRKALANTGGMDPDLLDVMAALWAEEGKVLEARDALLRSHEVRGHEEMRSLDWYVIGRLAEHYNIREAAYSAYGKVRPESEAESAFYVLAQRRLDRLSASAN